MTAEQLKNSILQMAVQGKLVPQDPNDEPASKLIERIREEKQKLIKEGKIKKEKNPSYIFRGEDNIPYEKVGNNEPVSIADEVPFEIPESWEWLRLSEVVTKDIKRGKSPKYADKSNIQVFAQKCNVKTGGIDMSLAKYLDATAFEKYSPEEYIQDKDIVVNSTGNGTLGRIGMFHDSDRISDAILVPDSHVTVIRIINRVSIEYVYYVLKYYQPFLESLGSGSTNQTELKPAVISQLFFPLPPIEEQHRISAKISELTPFIVKYHFKENDLLRLNKEFPEKLKKSILQDAVMGKLIPQDENDEPASVLLERIREEKQRLIAEGKLKKDKHQSIIYRRDNSHYEKVDSQEICIDAEVPFEIPESWSWCRLNDLVSFIGGYAYKSNDFVTKSDYQVLRLGNVKNDIIKLEQKPVFIPPELADMTSGFRCHENDILLTMTGTRGKRDYFFTVKVSSEKNMFINQRVGCLRAFIPEISGWLIYVLKSDCVLSQVFEHETGTANQGNLGAENILHTLIPLPPLSEQRRIIYTVRQSLSHASAL
ncbi:MAG: restriction endonuclease subunit S [Lachnospiraceae bacterium]|nr:restriction endonuclease subunit S [Lachnospiraceae bacterium]